MDSKSEIGEKKHFTISNCFAYLQRTSVLPISIISLPLKTRELDKHTFPVLTGLI